MAGRPPAGAKLAELGAFLDARRAEFESSNPPPPPPGEPPLRAARRSIKTVTAKKIEVVRAALRSGAES